MRDGFFRLTVLNGSSILTKYRPDFPLSSDYKSWRQWGAAAQMYIQSGYLGIEERQPGIEG